MQRKDGLLQVLDRCLADVTPRRKNDSGTASPGCAQMRKRVVPLQRTLAFVLPLPARCGDENTPPADAPWVVDAGRGVGSVEIASGVRFTARKFHFTSAVTRQTNLTPECFATLHDAPGAHAASWRIVSAGINKVSGPDGVGSKPNRAKNAAAASSFASTNKPMPPASQPRGRFGAALH